MRATSGDVAMLGKTRSAKSIEFATVLFNTRDSLLRLSGELDELECTRARQIAAFLGRQLKGRVPVRSRVRPDDLPCWTVVK